MAGMLDPPMLFSSDIDGDSLSYAFTEAELMKYIVTFQYVIGGDFFHVDFDDKNDPEYEPPPP